MTRARSLRDASQLVGPAVERMVEALDPPDEDLPLIAIARRQAAVIDAMPDEVAIGMMPNHAGPLIKVLGELAERARKRRGPERPRTENPVQAMRRAHAESMRPRAAR